MDSTGIVAEVVDHGINERFVNVGPEQFIPLVLEVMQQRSVSAAELARRLAISRTNLSRWLTRKRPLSAVILRSIFLSLEIDEMRAVLAIGRFGRWQHYFDPDVRIISDLIDVLPDALNKARSGATRYAVGVSGAMELARRVSDMIATNDRETERRRLERPFAGI
jgi:transcriptional regulator with XRE-family HTH domain